MDENSKIDRSVRIVLDYEAASLAIATAQRKESDELRSRSRPLYSLVVEGTFYVESVRVPQRAHTIYPEERAIGGPAHSGHNAGISAQTILGVRAWGANLPVTQLTFRGYSAARKGDRVHARIPCYEEEIAPDASQDKVYLPRQLRDKESAIELQILEEHGDGVARTEQSVEYEKFVKG